jgi:NitT/TauT family transport system substrate-binding protein
MRNRRTRMVLVVALLMLVIAPMLAMSPARSVVRAQGSLVCEPLSVPAAPAVESQPVAEPAAELTKVVMGYVPVSVFAPIYVAKEKGYFAELGVDLQLEPLPGGSDMVVLTANGNFDMGIGGVGPAFWNAIQLGLPLKVVAPGHQEGSPVATPLMISKANCESGAITSVADLKGKKVSVNARGATEYWLAQALATEGLTLDDIDLQTLPFPDAIVALETGAVDAAMIGEPLASKAEADGIAIRLVPDFPVQDVQPTMVFANADFLAANPDAAAAVVAGYLKAARELMAGGFGDPAVLAIIQQYTNVPAEMVAASVKPVYSQDGTIDIDSLNTMQQFFMDRGQLEYDDLVDPATFVDTTYVDNAIQIVGPAPEATPSA